ncbi:MAG: 3,4-dihydroxy-2-butanone-4-phosphate synthase [Dehalococcoidales bacterium]|nr:3,4-dihydroxy-2-butanone-4-phosphate synthase [Dehalococcoidales bacterium]
MNPIVERAIESLRRGEPVLVYDADGREEETDFVYASQFVTPESIRRMRKDGGGLICTTVPFDVQKKLGLPFMVDVNYEASEAYPVLSLLSPTDIPYDTKSAFSITINHRRTYTGITDDDRALTVSEFARLCAFAAEHGAEESIKEFGDNFRAPGHLHLLNTSEGILENRFGHTELSTALVIMAGLTPSATICEMMGDDGKAMSRAEAERYAADNGLVYLTGAKVIEAWREYLKS